MAPSPMADAFHPAERIVIPVQGTDREYEAQQWAVEFAAALSVPVYAVHVAQGEEQASQGDPGGRQDLFEFM
ncbi:MAG: universal stress protein, partial [Candidatus Thermoplasmatota archaeon]|nr:universal stress protein [Candidatus Thermoplasmatota archaeon]